MKRLLTALALTLTASTAQATELPPFFDDGMGADDFGTSHDPRRTQVIEGVCAASCTLRLAHPKACVHRDALLAFHSATREPGLPEEEAELRVADTNAYMMRWYPPKVRQWIMSRGGLTNEWLILEGEELVQTVKLCQ